MLIDELRALAKKAEVQGCVTGVWVKSQDEELQEVISSLRNNQNVNLTEILNALKSHTPDLPFKRTAFVSHMRGGCSCPTV